MEPEVAIIRFQGTLPAICRALCEASTHSQRRITYISNHVVEFWAKDKKLRCQSIVQLTPEEFIRAWMQHIPERYKHAVRSFGLFAPRALCNTSAALFAALGHSPRRRSKPLRWNVSIMRDFG